MHAEEIDLSPQWLTVIVLVNAVWPGRLTLMITFVFAVTVLPVMVNDTFECPAPSNAQHVKLMEDGIVTAVEGLAEMFTFAFDVLWTIPSRSIVPVADCPFAS